MKKTFSTLLLALLTLGASAQIRVACIGNSITYGHGIKDREHDTYPAQLQALLGSDFDVRNFGVSATTAQQKGDYPWTTTKEYPAAKEFLPQIAIFKLGTNDSKPQNWAGSERYIQDMEALALEFEQLPSHPRIIVALPAKAYELRWNINDSIIVNGEIPALRKMAKKHKWTVVDLHKATDNMKENFPDGIHPNPQGAGILAATMGKTIRKVAKKLK